ncbi:MAG: hypothetical protein R3A13_12435 [Bdellovibrionota bacterium]
MFSPFTFSVASHSGAFSVKYFIVSAIPSISPVALELACPCQQT